MLKSENLSWLANKEEARTNLGVYSIDQITELLRGMLTSENLNSIARTLSGLTITPWNWSGSASLYLKHPNGRMYEFFSDGNGAFGVRDKTNNTDVFRITPTETLLYKPLSSRNMRITSVWDPTQPKDATNKQYVDNKLNTKADLVAWKVPTNQLPSYVDDVLEFDTRTAFPATWEKGKIYIAINDDSQWRWTGTTYKKMVSSPWSTDAIPEGSQNLYFTEARAKGAVQSELNGKANANHNHDDRYYTETEINTKLWSKADLVGGKVPASQIDDSNLMHKSWDEVIGGNKTFNGSIVTKAISTKQDGKTNGINIRKEGELNRIDSFNDSSWFVDLNIRAKKLNFEWSSIVSNGQDWTGEWQSYTPTLSGDSWGGATLSDRQWWYKIIGKTCFVIVRGIIGNKGNCWGKFKVSAPVRAKTRTSTPISGVLQTIWWSIAQPKGIPFFSFDHIGLNGAWRWYRDIQRSEISVNDFFIFNGIYETE